MNWNNNNNDDGPWGSGGNNPWGGSSKRDLDNSIKYYHYHSIAEFFCFWGIGRFWI